MHEFTELVDRCTMVTLSALKESDARAVEALPATVGVKYLQMSQLQRAILAIGLFSLFESILQEGLKCADGFIEANRILDGEGEVVLRERFSDFQLAVNVLKHGRGRSYNALVAKATSLPFKLKLPGQAFFFEGDVSEIATLIEVDDKFVLTCADLVRDVSKVIRKAHPEFWY